MSSGPRATVLLVWLAATFSSVAQAHGAAPMPDATTAPAELVLGERADSVFHAVATAQLGDETEVEVQLTRHLEPADPLLGDEAPVADAAVTISIDSAAGAVFAGPTTAHLEGEAGRYGVHFPRLPAGSYVIRVETQRPEGPPFAATFALALAAAAAIPSSAPMSGEHEMTGHHAMAHPFLSHMGIPDGPGEISTRITGIRRDSGAVAGNDVGVHIEAGIIEGLGLHLRNDAITGDGMADDEDHGTELMVMYAPLKDAENTMGLSIFGEVAVPTRGKNLPPQAPFVATLPVNFGVGVGGRYMWSTYLLVDAIVHVAPTDLYDGVMAEYEGSLQVRPVGRLFLMLETSGEVMSEGIENNVLPAVKLGLGKTGPIIGVGVSFATTVARHYDRQLLVQLDWAFE